MTKFAQRLDGWHFIFADLLSKVFAKFAHRILWSGVIENVLGPYFELKEKQPNLVFIIVEGLGRDFVGPGAEFGGFTPYLDSLTTKSLYWENDSASV